MHGLLWTLFHTFFYWQAIGWLPGCLALAYVATQTRSTWPGIVAHAAANVPILIIEVLGVL